MKTLQFSRDEKKSRVTVMCADGEKSVYSYCAYCSHCKGVWVNGRLTPSPQSRALGDLRKGSAVDENLMNAALLFNSLVRDGTAIECTAGESEGFARLY